MNARLRSAHALPICQGSCAGAADRPAVKPPVAVTYVVQHVKLKRTEHQRLLRKAEVARQRAIAAQARLGRIDTAKSALRGAVTGAGRLVTDNISIVANEALVMANETADTVTRSVQTAAGAIETAARAVLEHVARGWRSLKA